MAKKGIILLVMILLIGSLYVIYNKKLDDTKEYFLEEDNLMGFFLEDESSEEGYTKTDTLPTSGYILNNTKSYCRIDSEKVEGTIKYDLSTKSFSITPFPSGEVKCYLYFDVVNGQTIQEIIASKTVSTRDDFSVVIATNTTGKIYSAEDDDGTTYYFAGAPTDNYVKFAGYYWRIIRVNGDGSIRLIYDGTSAIANGKSSTATQISTSKFNSSYTNNMYVGFMYTSGSVHGLGTSSTIKEVLDTWYKNNLTDYTSYIDTNAGFCGDRQPFTSTSGTTEGGGTGTTTTYYAAYIRLYINKTPSYKCTYIDDLYTISSSSKGNKALTYPIGLITADEVSYAGGVYNITNGSNYLYTGNYYWTMSPYQGYNGTYSSGVYYVHSSGYLYGSNGNTTSTYGVRPVINLRADTVFLGSGTTSDPYRVEGAS